MFRVFVTCNKSKVSPGIIGLCASVSITDIELRTSLKKFFLRISVLVLKYFGFISFISFGLGPPDDR